MCAAQLVYMKPKHWTSSQDSLQTFHQAPQHLQTQQLTYLVYTASTQCHVVSLVALQCIYTQPILFWSSLALPSNKGRRCMITPDDGGVPNVRGCPWGQPKEVPCTGNAPNLTVLSHHAITWPILYLFFIWYSPCTYHNKRKQNEAMHLKNPQGI
jgi:hypothetical protein